MVDKEKRPAEVQKYKEQWEKIQERDKKLIELLTDFTNDLMRDKDVTRPITVQQFLRFHVVEVLLTNSASRHAEIRTKLLELTVAEILDVVTRLSEKVNSVHQEAEVLEEIRSKIVSMQREDAALVQKYDRIEPVLYAFIGYLKDKGLNASDLLNMTQEYPDDPDFRGVS
jgi:hypothetical protein